MTGLVGNCGFSTDRRDSCAGWTCCRLPFAALLLLTALLIPALIQAQILNGRRLAMGGVVTSDNGGFKSSNVAFRAVPAGKTIGNIPLPLGLIDFAGNIPEFDPEQPDFNVFELVNLALNPPLNYALSSPPEISSDISIYLSQDSLQIYLGDARRAIPEESIVGGGVWHLPGIGRDFGPFSLNAYPLVHARGTLEMADKLREALRDAVSLAPNSYYGLQANARGQAALALQTDVAFCALRTTQLADDPARSDPRHDGSTALYVGAGPKYLVGLAFRDLSADGGITTTDTLFGTLDPLGFEMLAETRYATVGAAGGIGSGFGADFGAVFYWRNFEFGVGLNDVAAQIRWVPTVEQHEYDDNTDSFITRETSHGAAYTARIPVTTTINAAKRFERTVVAVHLVDTEISTTLHLGTETWLGDFALRGGMYRDYNGIWQYTGGVGFRFGRSGIDLAIATHSRNIMLERGAELALSFSMY